MISCFFIDFDLVALSSLLAPIRMIASPFSSICSVMNDDVGLIFNLSVHHRKALFGTG
jgi:hypothetical protein